MVLSKTAPERSEPSNPDPLKSASEKSDSFNLQFLKTVFCSFVLKNEAWSNTQFSNPKTKPIISHLSNRKPNNLQSLKTTSLKAVLKRFAILRLHPQNSHSIKTEPDKSALEKSQALKTQDSYSPLTKGLDSKSALVKVWDWK
jgi:hypothetical protein